MLWCIIKRVDTIVGNTLWICSFVEMQGSFVETQGSFVEMQGSFVLSTAGKKRGLEAIKWVDTILT